MIVEKIKTKYHPLVMGFLGGPGISKSSLAAAVFSELKWDNVTCELVSEYAKTKTWEKSLEMMKDQIYIFGKQQHAMEILRGQVDVIITDSPLLISYLYYNGPSHHFRGLIREVYDSYTNINVMLERVKPYHQVGRRQTEAEAREIDVQMREVMHQYNLPYIDIRGEKESAPLLAQLVKDQLAKMETIKETKERDERMSPSYHTPEGGLPQRI